MPFSSLGDSVPFTASCKTLEKASVKMMTAWPGRPGGKGCTMALQPRPHSRQATRAPQRNCQSWVTAVQEPEWHVEPKTPKTPALNEVLQPHNQGWRQLFGRHGQGSPGDGAPHGARRRPRTASSRAFSEAAAAARSGVAHGSCPMVLNGLHEYTFQPARVHALLHGPEQSANSGTTPARGPPSPWSLG